MAATEDIAESLTLEDIPVKLRCASCNKLAQDAVRLPCCDQNICADCQANKLETTCPICYHEPINAEDCRPNKALRQTIKIFLKRKAIDRENAKKKETRDKAISPVQESEGRITATQKQGSATAKDSEEANARTETVVGSANSSLGMVAPVDPESKQIDSNDIPRPSVESPNALTSPTNPPVDGAKEDPTSEAKHDSLVQQQVSTTDPSNIGNTLGPNINGMAFDGSALANMGFNGMGDMNQMMQMMQNGMANPMMAGFPNMMGMSGMGMDPLAMSQGMFGNFGGSVMMNGMNMGVGFDIGQGSFGGGFNGQPQGAWNSGGQNNFNQNSYASGGNFGANAGYGAGNNMAEHQGNFNQMHQPHYSQNNFHQHGSYNQGFHRGRGRGRGAYPYSARGRGHHHQVNQNFHANSASYEQQEPQIPVRRGSPEYTPMNGATADDASIQERRGEPVRDEFAPGDAEDRTEEKNTPVPGPAQEQEAPSVATAGAAEIEKSVEVEKEMSDIPENTKAHISESPFKNNVQEDVRVAPVPVPSSDASAMPPPPSPSVPTGPSRPTASDDSGLETSRHGGSEAQGHQVPLQARGFTRIPNGEISLAISAPRSEKPIVSPTETQGVGVIGAPTGPKAMRQRFDNQTAKADRGFSIVGRASAARTVTETKVKSTPSSRSRSRSPRKHHSSRHHRSRSASPCENEDSERRRERHRHRSRKHQDDYEDGTDVKNPKSARTRNSSIESSKRSNRRSHREREYEHDREKESGRSNHRSRRHCEKETNGHAHKGSRHRSRSADTDREATSRPHKSSRHHRSHEKDDDYPTSSSSGKRRRSRDEYEEDLEDTSTRDHRHHHRSKRSKHSSHDQTHLTGYESPSPLGSTARALDERISWPSAPAIPTGPKAQVRSDSHALEREKRDRERQFKELQRRALAGGGSGSSRRPSDSVSLSRRQSESEAGGGEGSANAGGVVVGGGGGGDRDKDKGIRINGAAARSGGRKMSVRYEDELDDLGR